jgi:hypothetical protein
MSEEKCAAHHGLRILPVGGRSGEPPTMKAAKARHPREAQLRLAAFNQARSVGRSTTKAAIAPPDILSGSADCDHLADARYRSERGLRT